MTPVCICGSPVAIPESVLQTINLAFGPDRNIRLADFGSGEAAIETLRKSVVKYGLSYSYYDSRQQRVVATTVAPNPPSMSGSNGCVFMIHNALCLKITHFSEGHDDVANNVGAFVSRMTPSTHRNTVYTRFLLGGNVQVMEQCYRSCARIAKHKPALSAGALCWQFTDWILRSTWHYFDIGVYYTDSKLENIVYNFSNTQRLLYFRWIDIDGASIEPTTAWPTFPACKDLRCCSAGTRRIITQCLYSVVITIILFYLLVTNNHEEYRRVTCKFRYDKSYCRAKCPVKDGDLRHGLSRKFDAYVESDAGRRALPPWIQSLWRSVYSTRSSYTTILEKCLHVNVYENIY